ncbi:uncharacterized protein LOC128535075 [Clarias gariepinus]|uniref:uncharacterized protein LOC128535075 n=1 Tax=Clarias gariepinus TaxID=13013 RepID=UPI00234E1376|nr:uncharacterized protein LOC128535075 [Clarias gariepinus]
MYTMSESHNIENQKFNKGEIIITTNLGGRGTDNKKHNNDLKSATKGKERSLTEKELNHLKLYANNITDEQKPATALEVLVLTKSDLLKGKGVCITVVDAKGKPLTVQSYPGTDPTAGIIELRLTKTPQTSPGERGTWDKVKDRIMGKDTPHTGHIDIMCPDGSLKTVNSSNQNCLFHAIVQATTNEPNIVVQQKAVELRNKVSEEILAKPHKYAEAVKIQDMFNRTNSSNKFKIEAGGERPRKVGKMKSKREKQADIFSDYVKYKNPDTIIKENKLGEAGTYRSLKTIKKATRGVVEADHIPAKNCIFKLRERFKSNPELDKSTRERNEAFHNLVMSTENDRTGNGLISMNALHWDHQSALTTGSSHESRACRHLQTETLASGNMEKALKQAFILANPETSDRIRRSMDDTRRPTGTTLYKRIYYVQGYKNEIEEYYKKKVISESERDNLMTWVNNERFLDTNTEEYQEIISTLRNKK